MGWLIAFSVFFTFLMSKILYGMRKEIWGALNMRYNLLDWKIKLKDKELLKEIDKRLDKLEK